MSTALLATRVWLVLAAALRVEFLWRKYAVAIDVELIEQRARGVRELVEIHNTVVIPVNQWRCGRRVFAPTLLVDRGNFVRFKNAVMVGISRCKIGLETRLHFGPRDGAVVVGVEVQENPDRRMPFFLAMAGTIRSIGRRAMRGAAGEEDRYDREPRRESHFTHDDAVRSLHAARLSARPSQKYA